MKKIYQNPAIMIVRVQTAKMIANSEKIGFGAEVESAVEAESRHRGSSLWDDDEDVDY